MIPVVALVGRPNVGKSTLFNRLTHTRDALVADFPGLTRDRKYGRAEIEGNEFIIVDTGGIDGTEDGVEGGDDRDRQVGLQPDGHVGLQDETEDDPGHESQGGDHLVSFFSGVSSGTVPPRGMTSASRVLTLTALGRSSSCCAVSEVWMP